VREIMTSLFSLYQVDYPHVPDERDQAIAVERLNRLDAELKPRVGDFVIMPDGSYERFSYDWGTGLQTCISGSFYLGYGYVSMSGSLNGLIPNSKIAITDEKKPGDFWFFHHDCAEAHRAVGVRALCRVYRVRS